MIGERIPEIAVRRFAISHKIFGDNQITIKAGIKERLNRVSALVEDNGDGNIGEVRAGKCRLFLTSTATLFSPLCLSPFSVRQIGTVIAPLHPRHQFQYVVNSRYPQR